MSIALLEQELLTFGVTTLEACGLVVPGAVTSYLYHCIPPEDCCTADGTMVVHWNRAYASDRFPARASTSPCPGKPVYELDLTYWECWPVPNDQGTPPSPAVMNAAAIRLADIADCIRFALHGAVCAGSAPFDCCGWSALGDTVPICPRGGCAGVRWSVIVGDCTGP